MDHCSANAVVTLITLINAIAFVLFMLKGEGLITPHCSNWFMFF